MRITIRPIQTPHHELDVTHCLVSAIAEEIWRLYGGNGELNWLEAERHLQRIVEEARALATEAPLTRVTDRALQTMRSRDRTAPCAPETVQVLQSTEILAPA